MRARTPHSPLPTAVLALAAAAAAGLGGCVSEVVPVNAANKPANILKGDQAKLNGPLNTTPGTPGNVTPAGTMSSIRVTSAVRPLGSIPYDGLTLPLITPDGRWVITQVGPAPTMESVLAETGAEPQLANAIKVFQITDGPNGGLTPVEWNQPPVGGDGAAAGGGGGGGETGGGGGLALDEPPSRTLGLLLGRAAGIDGGTGTAGSQAWALVERPNPDGSRWIGKLNLADGKVEWLVQGTTVNAQALLLRDGTLVYTRRKADQGSTELVIRPSGGVMAQADTPNAPLTERVARRDGWKYCQPITTPDQTMVAVLAISADDAQLLAFSTTLKDATGAPLLVARQSMGAMGATGAFQAVTSVEACPPAIDSPLKSTFLFINADRRRLALWEPVRGVESGAASGNLPGSGVGAGAGAGAAARDAASAGAAGSMSFLPAGAASAVRTHSSVASGLVIASSRGMDFLTLPGATGRIVTGAYIPRSSVGPDGTRLICFSPHQGSGVPMLDAAAVELVTPK